MAFSPGHRRTATTRGATAGVALPPAAPAAAGDRLDFDGFELIGANVKRRANAVLALTRYSPTPDVTTGSLALSDAGGSSWTRASPLSSPRARG